MTLNTVTLTWDFTDLVQSGQSATLVIEPTAQLADVTDGFIEVEVPRPVTFTGGTGQLAGIVANDNANVSPQGEGYTVTVTTATGVVIYSQTVVINHAAGATQNLASLSAAGPSPELAGYLEGTYPGGTPGAAEWLSGDGTWTAPTAAQVGADASGTAAADEATEAARAEGAEGTNATAIAAETSRAELAETGKAALAGAAFTGAVSDTSSISAGTFVQGARVIATGLGGATAASRYVGATTSGAPVSGSFNVGDFVIDQSGQIWVCTAAGSPGTWVVTSAAALATAETYAAGQASAAQSAAETYAAGQAGTAQSTAEGFATSAVGTETTRAEGVEAGKVGGATPAASVGAAPSAPTPTSSTTLVMAGLDETVTPAGSGRVLAIIAGSVQNTGTSITCTVGARYGTGTPPANGAAVTGARWGGVADQVSRPSAAGTGTGFAFVQVITGLTPSTAYWFDLAFDTGSNSISIPTVGVALVELPD